MQMMRNAHGSGVVRAAGQGWGRAPTYTQSGVGLHDGSNRPGLETRPWPSAGPPRDVLTVSLYPPAALQQAKKYNPAHAYALFQWETCTA